VATRVRDLRTARGMTVADLAARCAAAGLPRLTVQTLYKLEGQRSKRTPRPVSVDELLALAAALDVSPLHLLVPPYPSPLWGGNGDSRSPDDPNEPNDAAAYEVTPGLSVPMYLVRQWVRGYSALPSMDPWTFFGEVPPQERPVAGDLERMAKEHAGRRR
jgi:transcriptional regulator with XRE-family HTH domain